MPKMNDSQMHEHLELLSNMETEAVIDAACWAASEALLRPAYQAYPDDLLSAQEEAIQRWCENVRAAVRAVTEGYSSYLMQELAAIRPPQEPR
jgi:hypothetical protein